MQKQLFSVRDITADVYASPFTSTNKMTATRDFAHACRDPQSQLSKNPEDFQLFLVGVFDDDLGIITGQAPELICNATQFQQGD
ncbi:MAG: nonstructural protein [Microviridae sp.]|nr:MAG: nonstructural protein [Microviridae sp.]